MRLRPVFVVLLPLAYFALPAASARAAQPAITGTLDKPGYTVIALAYNGRATVAQATPAFKLVPPAKRVTLQLRGPDGRYAGPVILGKPRGKLARTRVITGVLAGTRLGTVRIGPGYGKARVSRRHLDAARLAVAKKGVPIGAGRLGFVKSSQKGRSGGGSDQDLDGVPNVFDIDNDGDRILDNTDASSAGKKALRAQTTPAPAPTCPDPPTASEPPECDLKNGLWVFSNFKVQFEDSVNANAGAFDAAAIDAALVRWANLVFEVAPGDTTELDCAALIYCSPSGAGHEFASPSSGIAPTGNPLNYNEGPAFPACCDPDGNGLGNLPQVKPPGGFALLTEAGSAQVHSGDTFIERVTKAGVQTTVPGTLNFLFSSIPALKGWTSSGGDSATVGYPTGAGALGTQQNPWPVSLGANGHLVITMTFWRPQRPPIAGSGETGLMDIGHLQYYTVPNPLVAGGAGGPPNCPASDFTTSDPNLGPPLDTFNNGFSDKAGDAPANAANTLTYSLDVSACLSRAGTTLKSGDAVAVGIEGRTAIGDNAAQGFAFKVK